MSGLARSGPTILSASTPTWKLRDLSLAHLSVGRFKSSGGRSPYSWDLSTSGTSSPSTAATCVTLLVWVFHRKGFYTRWPLQFKLGQKFLDGVFHGAAHEKCNRDRCLGHDTWQEPSSEALLRRSSSCDPAMAAVKFDVASRCPERFRTRWAS